MDIKRPESKQPLPDKAKRVFKGVLFDVYQWDQEMFDGTTQTFEKLKRPDTVTIIPVTEDGKIILLEEEQPGKKPFIAVPGGRVDEGEYPLGAAKRELMEETGYEAGEYLLWNTVQPVSKIDWAVYTFIAKNCKKVAQPQLDKGEKINLKFISFDEFVETAIKNKFGDKEILLKIMQAKIDPQEMKNLKDLIS